MSSFYSSNFTKKKKIQSLAKNMFLKGIARVELDLYDVTMFFVFFNSV